MLTLLEGTNYYKNNQEPRPVCYVRPRKEELTSWRSLREAIPGYRHPEGGSCCSQCQHRRTDQRKAWSVLGHLRYWSLLIIHIHRRPHRLFTCSLRAFLVPYMGAIVYFGPWLQRISVHYSRSGIAELMEQRLWGSLSPHGGAATERGVEPGAGPSSFKTHCL